MTNAQPFRTLGLTRPSRTQVWRHQKSLSLKSHLLEINFRKPIPKRGAGRRGHPIACSKIFSHHNCPDWTPIIDFFPIFSPLLHRKSKYQKKFLVLYTFFHKLHHWSLFVDRRYGVYCSLHLLKHFLLSGWNDSKLFPLPALYRQQFLQRCCIQILKFGS